MVRKIRFILGQPLPLSWFDHHEQRSDNTSERDGSRRDEIRAKIMLVFFTQVRFPPAEPMSDAERPNDSWVMSILAALAFIAWGLYANWQHGWNSRLQVAATQGFISLVSTYFSAEFVVALVRKFQKTASPVVFGGLTSYFVIYVLVLGGHYVAGTPEFWPTVIPGMITGLFFCFGYALRVHRKLNSTLPSPGN